MQLIQAVILGIVQGLTEFLPVSSSGHLVLAQSLMGWEHSDLMFDVWLHFATLIAVVVFFWADIISLTKKTILAIVVGSIPVALVGFLFQDQIELLFSSVKIVSITLLITGLFNFLIDKSLNQEKKVVELGSKQGLVVGLFQALAIIPGISRSGSTVLGALHQGADRLKAFKFSFLLSIPAIVGAVGLQLIKVVPQGLDSVFTLPYLLGALAAFCFGLFSLVLLKYMISQAQFKWFGVYCALLGLVSFLII